jgi:hypothetical protein
MSRVLTPEQRTLLTDLITAELTRARATAFAAGADPVCVGSVVTGRITALEAIVRTDRSGGRT